MVTSLQGRSGRPDWLALGAGLRLESAPNFRCPRFQAVVVAKEGVGTAPRTPGFVLWGVGGKSVTGSYLADRKRGLRESADARREELSTEGGGGDAPSRRRRWRAARLRFEAERRTLSDRPVGFREPESG